MSDKFFVGRDLTGFENNGKTRPISRVTLMIDDENGVTAGDDTGLEITATCAHATQAMADAILARMKGYQYQMYTADAANIDPAAELGDGVTADGVYGVISRISDDGGGYPDLTGPGEAELEDEFPVSGGPMTREINRKLGATRSYITKTATQIREEIKNEVEGLSSSFDVKLGEISGELRDEINDLSADLTLKYDEFSVSLRNGLDGLSADFDVKLDGLSATFSDELKGLSTEFSTGLSGLTSRVEDAEKGVSQLTQDVEGFETTVRSTYATKSELSSTEKTLQSSIEQTADGIRTEVAETYVSNYSLGDITQNISSEIEQMSTRILSTVKSTYATNDALSSTREDLESSIEQTASSIASTVKATYATKDELNSSYESLESTIEQTASGITSTVSELGGQFSELEQTVKGFTFTGPDGKVWINNGNLDLTGAITFGDLSKDVQDRFDDAVTQEIVHTLIKDDLMESPTIRGADIYGGLYHDLNGLGNLRLTMTDDAKYPSLDFTKADDGKSIFTVRYEETEWLDGSTVSGAFMSLCDQPILFANSMTKQIMAIGDWKFAGAVLSIAEEREEPVTQSDTGVSDGPEFEGQSDTTQRKVTLVDLKQKNGELEIALPDGTSWYLGPDGWHK